MGLYDLLMSSRFDPEIAYLQQLVGLKSIASECLSLSSRSGAGC